MSTDGRQPESDSNRPTLPTKAQIRTLAYGSQRHYEFSPEPPAQEPPPPKTEAADDAWIIAATKGDGWDIWLCDQVLRGCEIETQIVTKGIRSIRVRRQNYSQAIRKLQEQKQLLWHKPTGMANWIVSFVFLGVLAIFAVGGVIYGGTMSEGSVLPSGMVCLAVLLPVIILALFGVATAFRRR